MPGQSDLKFSKDFPLSVLPEILFEPLRKNLKSFMFRKKQFIYREGFTPAGLFIVRKGKVKIFKTTYNGKEVIAHIARENELLGYGNLISKTDYRTSACATEDTEVIFIARKLFFELVRQSPEFSLKLVQQFSSFNDGVVDKLADLATKQVRKRVAEMLLRMVNKHGLEPDQRTIGIILSREDMAGLVATNTETLVRTLSEFKKQRLLSLRGKRVAIMDFEGLSNIAEKF